jgi:hypothetical protein
VETTADLTLEMVAGVAGMMPDMLQDLTPEMLLALPPDARAVLPQDYLQAKLGERTTAPAPEVQEPEPVALPDSWIQAANAMGVTVETTADLTLEMVAGVAGMMPDMLQALTPEMLLAMSPESLAGLPKDFVQGLDPELQDPFAPGASA